MTIPETQTLVLGGGCFWCTEAVFVRVKGVLDVESGYANGHTDMPSYDDVCTGTTGYNEVVKLVYDPQQIGVRQLLEIFFLIHDPTTLNRQGHDVGTQYRSGIYFTQPEQAQVAQEVMAEVQAQSAQTVVTELQPLRNYHPAEDYHQDFFERHPGHGYCQAVAAPKVEKFRRTFAQWLRD
jgi:peptide-methionine (S)-S-oxide reductase